MLNFLITVCWNQQHIFIFRGISAQNSFLLELLGGHGIKVKMNFTVSECRWLKYTGYTVDNGVWVETPGINKVLLLHPLLSCIRTANYLHHLQQRTDVSRLKSCPGFLKVKSNCWRLEQFIFGRSSSSQSYNRQNNTAAQRSGFTNQTRTGSVSLFMFTFTCHRIKKSYFD